MNIDLRRFKACVLLVLVALMSACGLGMDAEERLQRGYQSLASGDYRAAAIDARAVLKKSPQSAQGRLLLGRAALHMGDYVLAETELSRALELGISDDNAAIELGRAYLGTGQFKRILDEFPIERAKDASENYPVERLRGEAFLALGQTDDARRMFQAALSVDPDDLNTQLLVVGSYMAENRLTQARATLEEIVSGAPNEPAVWLVAGEIGLLGRDPSAAVEGFQRAESLAAQAASRTDEVASLRGLVEAQLLKGDADAASTSMNRLQELAPDAVATRFLQGRLAFTEGRMDAAQAHLQAVLQANQQHRPAQMLLGAVHLSQGNLGQADMYLSSVLAAMPGSADARRLLAETRIQQNNADSASELLGPLVADGAADDQSLALAARASIAAGKFPEATDYLLKRIEADSGNLDLQLDLAAAYLSAGNTKAASQLLEGIDDSGDTAYRRQLLIILAQIRSGDFSSALAMTEEMLQAHPEDLRLYNLAGGINLSTQDFSTARRYFLQALNIDPKDKTTLMNLGRVAVAMENLDAARTRFNSILESDPADSAAMIALAKVEATEKNETEMVGWLQKAAESDKKNLAARILLARYFITKKRFGDAEAVADEALGINPDSPEMLALMGAAHLGQGKNRSALANFKRAVELAPNRSEFALSYARAQIVAGEKDGAARTLEVLERQRPGDVRSAAHLAILTANAGDVGHALDLARELTLRFPESEVPYVVLGELSYQNGAYGEGTEYMARALDMKMTPQIALRAYQLKQLHDQPDPAAPLRALVETEPRNTRARLALAQHFGAVGDTTAAIDQYQEVLRQDAGNFTALNNLAWEYFMAGDGQAEVLARRAYRQAPQNGAVVDTLGWILVRTGKYEEGIELLRRASALSGGRPAIKYHLAVALAESGAKREARAILQELLEGQSEFPDRADASALLDSL